MDPAVRCPCGSGRELDRCCGPFLRGEATPGSAEELMRSRYSAYVRGEVPYLIATHRPASGKKASSEEDVSRWSSEIRWSGLEILGKERGGPEDADGEVEFVARYEHGGQSGEHHERSRFSKIDGRWFYVDGTIAKNEPRRSIKIGRNDPCPCGSGKKYKKCCGT